MRPVAHTLEVPDAVSAWVSLGFEVDGDACVVGDVLVLLGRPWRVLTDQGIEGEPELPLSTSARNTCTSRPRHPNGAVGVDHIVAFTDDLDRTIANLESCGLECRRRADPQAFFNLSTLILELVQTGANPDFWGLTIVADPLPQSQNVGPGKPARQPGRSICTVRPEAHLESAMAFITPRVRTHPNS